MLIGSAVVERKEQFLLLFFLKKKTAEIFLPESTSCEAINGFGHLRHIWTLTIIH